MKAPDPGRPVTNTLEALREGLAPHYTVEREIGAGGMARVYLATEQHPPRKVAIKVMNPELSTPAFRERFIREIEVTSRLSHPHIVPILAAEECLFVADGPDGLCYYVMPYIEGESLRARLEREERLPLKEALRITLQVADGLSYAHAHGVIHRDIKPENILLAGDTPFVADFGIARAISAAGGPETLTGVGQTVGSPAYMSPEQLAGSRAIDARSDVYSLGCVLYEMLVGRPPLLDLAEGTASGAVSLEPVLRRQGVSQRTARLVKEVIARSLAALPADRFQTVDEFIASLRDALERRRQRGGWLSRLSGKAALVAGVAIVAAGAVVALDTRAPALDARRVVVTGFEDYTGDPALATLGALTADWVTQGLAHGGTVEVVPTATEGYVGAVAIKKLATRTGAGTVVVGSYYKDGDSVRFQLQIIDAARGTVWRVVEPVSAPVHTPLQAADAVRRRVTAVFETLFSAPPPASPP